MFLSACIADYLNHIKYERCLAKTTCKHYASWLHGFLNWCEANGYENPTLDTFNPLALRRYQMDKTKAGVRPRTVHSAQWGGYTNFETRSHKIGRLAHAPACLICYPYLQHPNTLVWWRGSP